MLFLERRLKMKSQDIDGVLGAEIQNSESIKKLIQQLVDEVQSTNQKIVGPKNAEQNLIAPAADFMNHTGDVRGRPLFYKYIGSGAGNGIYVELIDGSIKMDLINGIGIHLMGHSNPRVMAATVRGALSDIVNQGNLEPNKEYTQIIETVLKMAAKGSRLKYGWLSTCGTMANETALKISRQKNSPSRMILTFQNAFAGRSTMMAEVTDNPAYKQGLPEYNEVLRIPFYDRKDPESAEKTLRAMKDHVAKHEKNISVFCFEPMLGEGGYFSAPREFFVPMLEFCKSQNIAVWADEVQTFARTGEAFAYQTLDIGQYVDIATIAKTAQVGMTLYTEEYNPKPGLIAGTFSGATAALSAGIEILTMLQEGYLGPNGRILEIHKKFVGMLNRLNSTSCKGLLVDAGGMGLMIAVTPYEGKKEQVDALLTRLYANGIIAFSCGKSPVRVRFLIPAVIKDSDIDLAEKIIEKSILDGKV
jgi:acetylornithine/N-succinyldiaminopimelate aminotransferase